MALHIDSEDKAMIEPQLFVFFLAVRLPHWFDDADRKTSYRTRLDLMDIKGL